MQSYKSRVLFKGACSAIPEDAVLLEVGPHAIMRAPLRQNCAALPYVNTMKKGEDATLSLREAVAGLWRKGAALKWSVPDDVPGVRRLTPNQSAQVLSPSFAAHHGAPRILREGPHMREAAYWKVLPGVGRRVCDMIRSVPPASLGYMAVCTCTRAGSACVCRVATGHQGEAGLLEPHPGL